MNISAFSAATQSIHGAQARILSAASQPITTPEQIVDTALTLQSAILQTKLAAKTIQTLDENAKTLIDMLA